MCLYKLKHILQSYHHNIIVAVWKQHYLFLIFETFRSIEAFVWNINSMDDISGSRVLNPLSTCWTYSRCIIWETVSVEVQYLFNSGLYVWSFGNVDFSKCNRNSSF